MPSRILRNITIITISQEAVAVALEYEIKRLHTDDCYFKQMPIELQEKRDFMIAFLVNANFITCIPQGGCFLLANWTHLGKCIFDEFQFVCQSEWPICVSWVLRVLVVRKLYAVGRMVGRSTECIAHRTSHEHLLPGHRCSILEYRANVIAHVFVFHLLFLIAEQQIDFASENEREAKDSRFAKWLVKNHGIQGIPTTIFYSGSHRALGEDYIRFCFLKNNESLQQAARILAKWR